ncbi:ATP-binding protein [Candidatus Parabeggiatoa sp. HSG14]|uniref:ATP-binding protein n=1 Tax=Candidatus Parabeggiatoa sp. HSG14 TaxID=3055593 RepID=UPI0025A8E7FF|nr:ATP-binding protein [Thiotrichales bacterium HSG14]
MEAYERIRYIDKTAISPSFLDQKIEQDEAVILANALQIGLNQLYQKTAEQNFMEGALLRDKALMLLGKEKVARLEYLRQAFPPDIKKVESYQHGEIVPFIEDIHHEFKAVEKNQNPVENILELRIERVINAFLNTEGGVIYFGITKGGQVQGVQLNQQQQDLLKKEMDQLIDQFDPFVEKDLYNIHFVPIKGQNSGRKVYVVEIHVARGPKSQKLHRYKSGEKQAYLREDEHITCELFEFLDTIEVEKDDMLPIILEEIYKARGRPEDGKMDYVLA